MRSGDFRRGAAAGPPAPKACVHHLQLGKRVRECRFLKLAVDMDLEMKPPSSRPVARSGPELGGKAGVGAPHGQAERFQLTINEFGDLFLPCQVVMRHGAYMSVQNRLKPCR